MDLERHLKRHLALRVPSRSAHFAPAQALVREGIATRLLPGTYVLTSDATRPRVRAAAICACDPRAVITGEAATAMHVRHDLWPPVITFVSPRVWTSPPAWASHTRANYPGQLVRTRPFPHATPAAAVLQMAVDRNSADCIDDALRNRRVKVQALLDAVDALAHTRGNVRRRQLANDSLQRPWSSGERRLHRLLREARITGWVGNHRVRAFDQNYVIDVAFPTEQVAIEYDGASSHGALEFEDERLRHNDLVADGWRVLRITRAMLQDEPDVVTDRVRRVLRLVRG